MIDLTSPDAWLREPPKTWSLWGCTYIHVRPLNRWRMKQQRVRKRRALGSAAEER